MTATPCALPRVHIQFSGNTHAFLGHKTLEVRPFPKQLFLALMLAGEASTPALISRIFECESDTRPCVPQPQRIHVKFLKCLLEAFFAWLELWGKHPRSMGKRGVETHSSLAALSLTSVHFLISQKFSVHPHLQYRG